MLDKKGFDMWADGYDKTVQMAEASNAYPFAGYKDILNRIFNEVMETEKSRVLDIGFGTGVLTAKLYEHGHQVDGLDFSDEMIAIARDKMPEANLIAWDFSAGLPPELHGRTYDSIISTYALHHLTDEGKVVFIRELLPHLVDGGRLLIGDVAFRTRADLAKCRSENAGHWDKAEFYFVAEELQEALAGVCDVQFDPVSHCGGMFVLSK